MSNHINTPTITAVTEDSAGAAVKLLLALRAMCMQADARAERPDRHPGHPHGAGAAALQGAVRQHADGHQDHGRPVRGHVRSR